MTGATLTSNGVADMVTNGLQAYISFLSGGNASTCSKPEGERCGKCKAGMSCDKAECGESEMVEQD